MINTREIAKEFRLAHWTAIMRRRSESGLSIKKFCELEGIPSNVYFYWQRKLRELACRGLLLNIETEPIETVFAGNILPIEINGYWVLARVDTDPELLAKTCKVLLSLC